MNNNLIPATLLAMTMCATATAKEKSPVVMTINGQDVTRTEFEYFYNKNNEQDVAEEKTFDEYVELFVNYKLKVQEALSRGIDTTQAYKDELAGYRKQLAEPYLENKNWKKQAIDEIIANRKYEVHAAHILISLDEKATPRQIAEAQAKLDSVKMQLANGASFDSLARAVSQDPSAVRNGGDLGYFSPLMMVYPFEEAAFNTPVGQYVQCRSQFGLHLLNIIDKRESQGEVLVAHIMKMFPRNLPKQLAMQQTRQGIDSIYGRLQAGEDFAALAKKCSEDQYTAQNGGAYPWINSSARFPQEWLDVAFNLKPGEYSQPFATDFGWHIMKQLDRRAEAPTDSATLAQLEMQIERDPARKAHYVKLQEELWMANEGLKVNEKALADKKNRKKVAMTIGKQKYTAQQFDDFCAAQYGEEASFVPQAEALDAWKRAEINAYMDANLESKYAEFRNLYKEYHDGILLFDVASEAVWDKAANDTLGLRKFFADHKSKYNWDKPHFKGAFIECAEDELLVAALKKIYDNCNDIQECANQVRATILTDTILTPNPKSPRFHIVNGLYAPGDNNTVDRERLGLDIPANEPRANMPIRMTYGRVLADGPEELEDVRGAVVTDYQDYLEEEWCKQLRAKFPVILNQKELDKIKQGVK
ncbi:MAG: peptidylprolyl isomerase [Bacteroidales bacterium]|nr:peptidylprolyl isomerase [Bacteroidales bacterium]